MSLYEIKPCPFCGSINVQIDKCTSRVRCKNCFCTSGLIARLADMVYVSPSTISHYVNGERGKKYASLVDICKALNVSADYLLGLSDEMER